MFQVTKITQTNEPSIKRHRKRLAVAISTALLSIAALNSAAGPTQAAEPDLLAGANCTDQDTVFQEVLNPTYGSVPGWTFIERQRKAVVCLFNYARARYNTLTPGANLPKLSACSQDATYCDIGTVAIYTKQQVANLTTAAQWKAMEVDYMCSTTGTMQYTDPVTNETRTVDNPHTACNRSTNYWLDWWKANNPGVTYTTWGENLGVGYYSYHLSTPRTVINAWLTEKPDAKGHRIHRENILNPAFHYVGVGVTPAWYGNIASGYPWNWTGFRQVMSADFID